MSIQCLISPRDTYSHFGQMFNLHVTYASLNKWMRLRLAFLILTKTESKNSENRVQFDDLMYLPLLEKNNVFFQFLLSISPCSCMYILGTNIINGFLNAGFIPRWDFKKEIHMHLSAVSLQCVSHHSSPQFHIICSS